MIDMSSSDLLSSLPIEGPTLAGRYARRIDAIVLTGSLVKSRETSAQTQSSHGCDAATGPKDRPLDEVRCDPAMASPAHRLAAGQ
jgi:hypothetical protein